jgi:hypothetical protein
MFPKEKDEKFTQRVTSYLTLVTHFQCNYLREDYVGGTISAHKKTKTFFQTFGKNILRKE